METGPAPNYGCKLSRILLQSRPSIPLRGNQNIFQPNPNCNGVKLVTSNSFLFELKL